MTSLNDYDFDYSKIKGDINHFFEFMDRNRDKDFLWFEKNLDVADVAIGSEAIGGLDVYPDENHSFTCYLDFRRRGDYMKLSEICGIWSYDISLDCDEYNKALSEFFNEKVRTFNGLQQSILSLENNLGYSFEKGNELISALAKFFDKRFNEHIYDYEDIAHQISRDNSIKLHSKDLDVRHDFSFALKYDFNCKSYKFEVNDVLEDNEYDVTFLFRCNDLVNGSVDSFIDDLENKDFNAIINKYYDTFTNIVDIDWNNCELKRHDIKQILKKYRRGFFFIK